MKTSITILSQIDKIRSLNPDYLGMLMSNGPSWSNGSAKPTPTNLLDIFRTSIQEVTAFERLFPLKPKNPIWTSKEHHQISGLMVKLPGKESGFGH